MDGQQPFLNRLEPESHVPGVVLVQANFAAMGRDRIPFRGGRFTVDPGCTSRLDQHDVRECWMIARGVGVLTYDGQDIRVAAGDTLFFESKHTHQIYNSSDDQLVINTVWWDVDAG